MIRAPSRHGSGKCVGVGIPNTSLDAETVKRLRAKKAARDADPQLQREWQRHCAIMSSKRHSAKKPVTLPTFNFMKEND